MPKKCRARHVADHACIARHHCSARPKSPTSAQAETVWHSAQPGEAVSPKSSPTASAADSSSRPLPPRPRPTRSAHCRGSRAPRPRRRRRPVVLRQLQRLPCDRRRSRGRHGPAVRCRPRAARSSRLGTGRLVFEQRPPPRSHAEATASSPRKSRWSDAIHWPSVRPHRHRRPGGTHGTPARARRTSPLDRPATTRLADPPTRPARHPRRAPPRIAPAPRPTHHGEAPRVPPSADPSR